MSIGAILQVVVGLLCLSAGLKNLLFRYRTAARHRRTNPTSQTPAAFAVIGSIQILAGAVIVASAFA